MFSHIRVRSLLVCACAALAVGTPVTRAAAPVNLAINPATSRIDVDVKVTIDSFTAHLTKYQAAVAVDPGSRTIQAASLTFAWADLKTGKPDRDAEMNRWQDSAAYPTGRFTLARLTPTSDPGIVQATGTLELHGRTKPVAFRVTLRQNGGTETVDGETPVDVRDFGLRVIRKFGVLKVDPVVHVRFHLEGALPSAS